MPVLPVGVRKETEIAAAAADVERSLAPDVVRIRFAVEPDWKDDWAVFFRVVLRDEAGETKDRLWEVTEKVREALDSRLDFDALGLLRYHNFRSVSEQAVIKEQAWA